MKKISYLLTILILSLFFSLGVNAASSKFNGTVSLPGDITEGEIVVVVGFEGEDVMVVKKTISYDNRYLELVNTQALDNFTITTSNKKKDGKWTHLNLLADSMFSFRETNYAILTFKVLDKFKIGRKVDLFLYNYEAAGEEKYKYRDPGMLVEIERESAGTMLYITRKCDKAMKVEYWCVEHWYLFVIIALLIIGIVTFIILVPGKRMKEARAKEQRDKEDELEHLEEQKEIDPIKIDFKVIDEIEGVKEKDMTEAIVVGETKAFEGSLGEGKNDNVKIKEETENINETIDAFNMEVKEETEEDLEVLELPKEKETVIASTLDNTSEEKEDLVLFQPTFEEGNDEKDN